MSFDEIVNSLMTNSILCFFRQKRVENVDFIFDQKQVLETIRKTKCLLKLE